MVNLFQGMTCFFIFLFLILSSLFVSAQSESFRMDYWQEGGMRAISQPWFQIRGNKLINITSQPATGVWKKIIVRDTIVLTKDCIDVLVDFVKVIKATAIVKRNAVYPSEITHCLTMIHEKKRIDFRLNNMTDLLVEYLINIINLYLPVHSRVLLPASDKANSQYVKN